MSIKILTWPPIELLLAEWRLPQEVVEKLSQRYLEHAGEYVSKEVHDNGMPINLAMYKDNLTDIEEELVDAIFNALVFKMRNPEQQEAAGWILQLLDLSWDFVQDARKKI